MLIRNFLIRQLTLKNLNKPLNDLKIVRLRKL